MFSAPFVEPLQRIPSQYVTIKAPLCNTVPEPARIAAGLLKLASCSIRNFHGEPSSQLLLPILFQHQLVYSVCVKHLMHQHVPEHYIHRVVAERLMLGRPLPILCG